MAAFMQQQNGATRSVATWLFLFGLVSLIVPTAITLVRHDATQSGDVQSIVVIAIALAMFAQKWLVLPADIRPPRPFPVLLLIMLLLVIYAAARAYDVLSIEVMALILILWTLFLEQFGLAGARIAWFPLLFLGFIIPVPGAILSTLTAPLKIGISWLAAMLLHGADYPIARAGVTLYVAQHQLLVEDACAGLNTLMSLMALCCFYIYTARSNDLRGALPVFLMVVPIAVLANFLRVIMLILVTYYANSEIANSIIHQLAGVVMLIVALAALMGVNSAVGALATPPQ